MGHLLAVVVLLLLLGLVVLCYRPLRTPDRHALAGKTLLHFTSDASAPAINNGTVTLVVPGHCGRGVLRRVVQWSHDIGGRSPATYVYTQTPSVLERKFHHSATPTFLVEIAGSEVLERHPGRMYRSLWGHAVALPAGYTGPGTITAIPGWPPT